MAIEYCTWKKENYDEGWVTTCHNIFEFYEGGPKENGFKYCPYCGEKLVERQAALKQDV